MIMNGLAQRYDVVTNITSPRWLPDGWDYEVLSARALTWLDRHSTLAEREHVTPALYRSPKDLEADKISVCSMRYPLDLSGLKWSVDTQDDLDRVRDMYHE